MTIRAHDLARLLLSGPNHEVCTWHADLSEDHAIEQVVAVEGWRETVIVIGQDMNLGLLSDGGSIEVLFGDGPGIAHAVTRHQQQQKKAQGE